MTVVKSADKGGVVVVWRSDLYQKEALRQLSDTLFYAKIHKDLTSTNQKLVKNTIQNLIVNQELPDNATNLVINTPRTSCIYLYSLYTSPLGVIAKNHQMNFHPYADDRQLYISFKTCCTNDMELSKTRMEAYVRDIDLWMVQNRLNLNHARKNGGAGNLISLSSKTKHSWFDNCWWGGWLFLNSKGHWCHTWWISVHGSARNSSV